MIRYSISEQAAAMGSEIFRRKIENAEEAEWWKTIREVKTSLKQIGNSLYVSRSPVLALLCFC